MDRLELDLENPGAIALPGEVTSDHRAEFAERIGGILGIIMIVALLLLLFYLVWGAMEWLTSGGDNSKLQSARNRMTHAIVGILILSSTLALFMFVQYILGIEFITFGL